MAWEITIVDGTEPVSAYAPDGSFHVVDVSTSPTNVGAFHPSGARNVTFVSGEDVVGIYAPNGSFNIVDMTEFPSDKIYHPCGALMAIVINDFTEEEPT